MRRLLAGLSLTLAAGCSGGQAEQQPASSAVTGRVDVFAAASLTDAFERLGEQFEAANPGATVTFSFGASSALAQSIVGGAPADVFAAASPVTMDVVATAGDARDPVVFTRNRLVLAVPTGNPAGVRGLADLARPDLKVALCAEQVPCGAAATTVLEAAGVQAAPDTLEQDVRAVLGKVRMDEVDAALVYRTDVLAGGDEVEGIAFPEADDAVLDYPAAVLSGAADREAAQAFLDLLLSEQGQQLLTDAGFDGA